MISIIIPTYNRAKLIKETLDSVAAQTYQDWECIVVDDGSTDDTEMIVTAFAKADKRFSYHKRPEHLPKGANACRNYGFEVSKGGFVKWFDSDDILVPEHFEKCMVSVEKEQKLEAVICQYQRSKDFTEIMDSAAIPTEPISLKKYIFKKQLLQTAQVLWNRLFLEKMIDCPNFFDTALTQSQDYDFHVRALTRRPKIKYLGNKLFYLRRGHDSITAQFGRSNSKHLESFLKVKLKICSQFPDDREIVLGMLNNILDSMRLSIYANKSVLKLHVEYLKRWLESYDYVPKNRIWPLIYLSRILSTLGHGALFFKNVYTIKNVVDFENDIVTKSPHSFKTPEVKR